MTPIRLNIEHGNALNKEVGNLQMSFCKVSPDARQWVPARQELWPVQEEGSWLCALILPHRRTYTLWAKRAFIRALTFGISFVLQGVWAAQSMIKNNPLFWSIAEFFQAEHFGPFLAKMCSCLHRCLRRCWGFGFILSFLFMHLPLKKLTSSKRRVWCMSVLEYVRTQEPV